MGAAQSLPVTQGLQLWLEADAGVTTNTAGLVTAWADQSGQGNNAVQSDPTQAPSLVQGALNRHAVVNFPGVTRGSLMSPIRRASPTWWTM